MKHMKKQRIKAVERRIGAETRKKYCYELGKREACVSCAYAYGGSECKSEFIAIHLGW